MCGSHLKFILCEPYFQSIFKPQDHFKCTWVPENGAYCGCNRGTVVHHILYVL
jgi:hypothetical protein